jgi:hypothetical protein
MVFCIHVKLQEGIPPKKCSNLLSCPLLFNIAKENGPFSYEIYDVLPLDNADFP